MTAPMRAERPDVSALRAAPRSRVLIIGGGINGIATFRDLALQGISVALVDQADYVSGASAASSHMIHGGIRYLENGEFRLVRESVQERNRLLRLAPHFVKPLETTIPIYSTFSGLLSAPLRFLTHRQHGGPKERGALLIKLGLVIYDAFSRDGGSVPRHRFVGRKKALAELAQLNSSLKYAATYFDAAVHDPERLAIDLLQDARGTGAHARSANYVAAIGATDTGVLLEDRISGEQFSFEADVVVNATGAWADLTNGALNLPSAFMGGTKGSHIVLDHPELLEACGGREIFFENSDGRIVLIYPINGRVLVGTTDLIADVHHTPVITSAEISYFFDLVHQVFPGIELSHSSIVYTYAGIRPLPRADDAQPGFISRDYRIEASKWKNGQLLTLVGGKLTTFRAMSAHLADEVLALLRHERTVSTTRLAIGGGVGYPHSDETRAAWVTERRGSFGAARVQRLLLRYGTRATEVMACLAAGDDAPLEHAPDFSSGEIRFFCAFEHAVHIDDVLLRRTTLAFTGRATRALIEELSRLMAALLDWTEEGRVAEVARALDTLRTEHPIPSDTRSLMR